MFLERPVKTGKGEPSIIGITPPCRPGALWTSQMPSRASDVGIAEQHAVTFSVGLATKGPPHCNIYSSFIQRVTILSYDVAYRLKGYFLSGQRWTCREDGAHTTVYWYSAFRPVPILPIGPMKTKLNWGRRYTCSIKGVLGCNYLVSKGIWHRIEWRSDFKKEYGRPGYSGREDIVLLTIGTAGNYALRPLKSWQRHLCYALGHAQYQTYRYRGNRTICQKMNNYHCWGWFCNGGLYSAANMLLQRSQCNSKGLGVPDRFRAGLWASCGRVRYDRDIF